MAEKYLITPKKRFSTSLSKPFYFRGWYDLTYENLRKRKLHFVETLF
nr:MAG TPA: hypothetical protein [Caudoviricetes sp.]